MPTIRASMLPAYNDCSRKVASQQYREYIEAAGYRLNSGTPTGIGALLGISVHRILEKYFVSRLNYDIFDFQKTVDETISQFEADTSGGCLWDDTTSNKDTAIFQMTRMSHLYIETVGKNVKPLATELNIKVKVDEQYTFSGHIDLICEDLINGGIYLKDFKTGAINRSHYAQLGGYSLLCKSGTQYKDITKASIDFIQRSKKTKPQNEIEIVEYQIELCEHEAWQTVLNVKNDLNRFIQTGQWYEFRGNPQTMLCSEKYCNAHGTDFCPISKHKRSVA